MTQLLFCYRLITPVFLVMDHVPTMDVILTVVLQQPSKRSSLSLILPCHRKELSTMKQDIHQQKLSRTS